MNSAQARALVLGGALGDALGSEHEGCSPGPIKELRLGAISDDTQLTIATCRAVKKHGAKINAQHIADSLLAYQRETGFRGLGAATAKAVRELSFGGHWALVGRRGEMAAGNGAAIRVGPLALVLDLSSREGRRTLRDICRITHHNDEAYAGALAIALTLAECGARRSADALFELLSSELPDTAVRDRIMELAGLPDVSVDKLAEQFGQSGYVVESVPLAIAAFVRAQEDGFLKMVREIIEAGGDCDSIAAMAGQCFAVRFGANALPQELVAQLPKEVLETAEWGVG